MKILLPLAIIVAFSICYMEWGGGNSAFVFETEMTIFKKDTDLLKTLTHPLILLGFVGQVLLLVSAFTEGKKRKWLSRIGISMLSVIVFFVLLAGAMSLNWKQIASALPFGVLAVLFLKQEKKYAKQ